MATEPDASEPRRCEYCGDYPDAQCALCAYPDVECITLYDGFHLTERGA